MIAVLHVFLLKFNVNAAVPNAITLPNIELPALKTAQLIGPVAPEKKITFTVWLKLRNKSQLDQVVDELYSPHSPRYQQFLNQKEFNDTFAPSNKTMAAVANYFAKQGMKTKNASMKIRVTGSAKQIEQVFQIKINNYRYNKKTVYGNTSAPTIAGEIAPFVASITGLSNIPYTHPQYRQRKKTQFKYSNWKPEDLNLVWHSFLPQASPTTKSLEGFTGAELRIAYNLDDVAPVNGTTIDGSGQTIVIIDGCGNASPTDIMNYANQYNTANNLPLLSSSNFTVVTHEGHPYTGPCPDPSG